MFKYGTLLLGLAAGFFLSTAFAADVVNMHLLSKADAGKSIGTVVIKQTKYGVLFTPKLRELTPGQHGFHVHEFGSCGKAGMAAGGHFDPQESGKHLGPYKPDGHLGDLPVLVVGPKGRANLPMLAPRLKLSDLKGHALMIHVDGDNYSDSPKKLGGGGARVACGVIR